MANAITLTPRSHELFMAYYRDAANWNGVPLVGGNVGGSKEDRGNLTDLKQAGLITTFKDGRSIWIEFTEEAHMYAATFGVERPSWAQGA